ncbi:MAG: ABC transporter permease [Coriobacteriia bacterium]|nr:ABC transporter permease [Coriobacteriia bacterium]
MSLARIKLLMWKEFAQLRRDRMLLPLVFIQPLLQLILFGYVVGSDVSNIPTAIIDADRTVASRQISSAIENTGYFTIVERPAEENALRPLMDGNRVQLALVIPAGLERGLERGEQVPVQIIVDGVDSKTASVASGYATQALGEWNRQRAEATGLVPQGAGVDARVRVLFNPSLRSVNAMVPGLVAFILMLSSTALMAQAIVRERERGTLEQMFVTPITRGEYLIGKLVPYVLLSVAQILAVMTVGILWFRVPFNGNVLIIAAGMALFMFTTLGQGLIISTVSRTRHQAQQMTMFLLIPTIVLSGFIFPIESMPALIVPITYLIPLRYALELLRANFMKGSGFVALWPQFAAMAVFSTAIFALALARFRKRLAD